MTQRPDITDLQLHKVLMSNRQYAALKMFISQESGIHYTEALNIDQRSFGSLYSREYIRYDTRTGLFLLTAKGRQAMSIFETTTVIKEHPGDYFSRRLHTIRALADFQRSKHT